MIVHGLDECDQNGGAPWRVRQWVAQLQNKRGTVVVLYEPKVGHDLSPWILATKDTWTPENEMVPPLTAMVQSLLSDELT